MEEVPLGCVFWLQYRELAGAGNQKWTLPCLLSQNPVVHKVNDSTFWRETNSVSPKYCFLAKILWVTADIPCASSAIPAAPLASSLKMDVQVGSEIFLL